MLASYVIVSEEKQKSVDIESICELLDLVLGSQFRPQIDSIIKYLKVGNILNSASALILDIWCLFLKTWKLCQYSHSVCILLERAKVALFLEWRFGFSLQIGTLRNITKYVDHGTELFYPMISSRFFGLILAAPEWLQGDKLGSVDGISPVLQRGIP